VRKFTRKPKKRDSAPEEMVLVPEEYRGPDISREDLYRRYFFSWKAAHDELLGSLIEKRSVKKQVDCVAQAVKGLKDLRPLLVEDRRKDLDAYIGALNDLSAVLALDIYSNDAVTNRQRAERLKRKILRDFSYNNVQEDVR